MAKRLKTIKKDHSIIEGILPLLEIISKIQGVQRIIPAVISYNPCGKITGPYLKIQRETNDGYKLLAHSKGRIQEIFIVVDKEKRKPVFNEINDMEVN